MTLNIQHAILLLLCILLMTPAYAQKKNGKKDKKHKTEVVVDNMGPDPVCHKAKPDRHPKPQPEPRMFAHGGKGSETPGIDVSHYQGNINWSEVATDPKVGYVYLKATEGVGNVDNTYQRNLRECKRVGLKVGSYLFFRAQYGAKAQFDLFKQTVPTGEQDLLPMVDVEAANGVSAAVLQSRLLELCDLLEKEYGSKPLIYSGQNFYNKYLSSNARLRTYKLFIARYDSNAPVLNGGDDYLMWQYSDKGRVKGIRGNVDMSHFVGRHSLQEIMIKK